MPGAPPVLLNTLPKSGTHLLIRVFEGLPGYAHTGVIITTKTAEGCEDASSDLRVGVSMPRGMKRPAFVALMEQIKPGTYSYGHIPYSSTIQAVLEDLQIKMVALVRDPRAVVCSFTHFILDRTQHDLHLYFAARPTWDDQLMLAIRGIPPDPANGFKGLLPIATCFESVARWSAWPGCELVFFEDLIGPRGGGGRVAQHKSLNRILAHLAYMLDEEDKETLRRSLFTEENLFFRKGQINDWKNYFTDEMHAYFEQHAGRALQQYQALSGRFGIGPAYTPSTP